MFTGTTIDFRVKYGVSGDSRGVVYGTEGRGDKETISFFIIYCLNLKLQSFPIIKQKNIIGLFYLIIDVFRRGESFDCLSKKYFVAFN
jgi:hypothetical protein